MAIDDKAAVIEHLCELLSAERLSDAAEHLREYYPFQPVERAKRSYTIRQQMEIFVRDGFLDRYRGTRLVFPPALRLISAALPEQFPYRKNGKMTTCHFSYWELFPSIDHVIPVARGGEDNQSNWVCCSMLTNQIKANWTMEEIGWKLHPPGKFIEWDGLLTWFVMQMTKKTVQLTAPDYCKQWLQPAKQYVR